MLSNQKKNILITGGAGFIGSHLVKRLVNLGFKVTVTVKYKSVIDCHRLISVWSKINVIFEINGIKLYSVYYIACINVDLLTIINDYIFNHHILPCLLQNVSICRRVL